jgi:hypothetical protein
LGLKFNEARQHLTLAGFLSLLVIGPVSSYARGLQLMA